LVEHHCRRCDFSWLVDNLLFCVLKSAVLGWRSMYTFYHSYGSYVDFGKRVVSTEWPSILLRQHVTVPSALSAGVSIRALLLLPRRPSSPTSLTLSFPKFGVVVL
jgi:hypothetical protein